MSEKRAQSTSQLHPISSSDEEDSAPANLQITPQKKAAKRNLHEKIPEDDSDADTPSEDEIDEILVKKKIRRSTSADRAVPKDYGFFLTKVSGIDKRHNEYQSIGVKDILHEGYLIESAQFNYMFDIPWVMDQYPERAKQAPVLIVHGDKGKDELELKREASKYSNITLCQAGLYIPFGTHHTKMMLLLYRDGLRVVIHTSNMIANDWFQKTQGAWISPVFPPMKAETGSGEKRGTGDSPTNFKADILQYLGAYKKEPVNRWCALIRKHDFSSCRVFLIGSTPGRFTGGDINSYGHLKLRKVLKRNCRLPPDCKSWPVIGQFSSIGSLGPGPENWLRGEWLVSLSSTSTTASTSLPPLNLVFPTAENVRMSLEGYKAGSCLPYQYVTSEKQGWLTAYMNQWRSNVRGRSKASPHLKSYTRVSPDCSKIAWFMVTSANLSKAAWGSYEKNQSQLMIRSYELGVLFLPEQFDSAYFSVKENGGNPGFVDFPFPYDLPLTSYAPSDKPWICDIPYTKLDSHGEGWLTQYAVRGH